MHLNYPWKRSWIFFPWFRFPPPLSLRDNRSKPEKSDIFSNKFQTLVALSSNRIDKFSSNFDYKILVLKILYKYLYTKKTFNRNLRPSNFQYQYRISPSNSRRNATNMQIFSSVIFKLVHKSSTKLHVHKGVVGEEDRIRDDPRE